ncbi:unnamed protein product [Rhodiola kirilowii]
MEHLGVYLGFFGMFCLACFRRSSYSLEKGAAKISEFRPISLNGVKMKVISKVIVNRLQIIIDEAHSKYLGLPLLMNRKRNETFHGILDKMWGKTQTWKAKTLSVGGNQRSIHWIHSEILRNTKEEGGLRFINFKHLNMAFLAKQAWRISINPHLLVILLIGPRRNDSGSKCGSSR